jgi:hypothetical protein
MEAIHCSETSFITVDNNVLFQKADNIYYTFPFLFFSFIFFVFCLQLFIFR